ncbi:MAG TPA: hypothetical protein VK162_02720 [Streptosporangiaceae bacterium]|nr:hypothetical protein [Streptosporangiaceae bacterium]
MGFGYPSSKAFGLVGKAYETAIRDFAEQNAIAVVRFAKGDNREEIARPYLEAAAAEGGKGKVALIGVGQEKASAWRSWTGSKRDQHGRPLQEWGRQMTFVNHFYFYLWDPEWGPTFWKVNCYAPFPVWIWLLCVKTHKTHYAAARIMSRAAARVLIVAVCEITASHNPERSMLLEPGWTRGRRQQ